MPSNSDVIRIIDLDRASNIIDSQALPTTRSRDRRSCDLEQAAGRVTT
jgi:hypothetical protein